MCRKIYSSVSAVLLVGSVMLAGPAVADESRVIFSGHTANWYAPERSGEGWVLEVLNPEQALLYWFTYDEEGGQRWLTALGDIVDDSIEFPELMVTSGGRFGPDFDPDEVVREFVGEGVMRFDDCHNGVFEYSAFGQTQLIGIRRLTRSAGLSCADETFDAPDIWATRTGSWYDRSHSGEGFIFQWMERGEALAIWFSYDTEGNQYWMLGVGQQDGEQFVFEDLHATRGARFGHDFERDDVERFTWGDLAMVLGCDTGLVVYDSVIPEFGSGEQQLSRLTRPEDADCVDDEPPPPPDLGQAQWRLLSGSGPQLSELPTAVIGDDIYVAGGLLSLTQSTNELWRFRPASGQWTRLRDLPGTRDHAMMTSYDGSLYYFGGYASALSNASRTAWRYDPATDQWSSLADMPTTLAAGGAAVLDDRIYVTGINIASIYRYDPATDSWETLPLNDTMPRDHSAIEAYNGEIWILGGRAHHTGVTHNHVTIYDPASGTRRAGPPMNSVRSGHAVAVVAGHILVAGGESFTPFTMVETVEVYHPGLDGWQTINSLPVAVHGAGAAVVGDKVYVMLGSIGTSTIVNHGHVQVLEMP